MFVLLNSESVLQTCRKCLYSCFIVFLKQIYNHSLLSIIMGVHGLWKLLEAAGKPVPLESLENKVLAVGILSYIFVVLILCPTNCTICIIFSAFCPLYCFLVFKLHLVSLGIASLTVIRCFYMAASNDEGLSRFPGSSSAKCTSSWLVSPCLQTAILQNKTCLCF